MEQMRSLVDDRDQVSPRSLIASAAIASAEFLAAATGQSQDVAVIHRAYEEVFAALEQSDAITELFNTDVRVAATHSDALTHLQKFRLSLASIGGENARDR
jgi:microcompartment protein CcmL/EutN